jgi:hypothetical protein
MLLFFLNFEKPTEELENTIYFKVDLSCRIMGNGQKYWPELLGI